MARSPVLHLQLRSRADPQNATATATASSASVGSPDTSATGIASINFAGVQPALKGDSVTVTDSLNGTLGTVSASTQPLDLHLRTLLPGSAGHLHRLLEHRHLHDR